MAYYMTEEQVRAERIRWNMSQLTEEQIDYCYSEARKLQMMNGNNPDITDNSIDSWLDCIAENLRIMNDHHRGQYCSEMGEQ